MVVGDFGAPLEMTVRHVPVRSLPADWDFLVGWWVGELVC